MTPPNPPSASATELVTGANTTLPDQARLCLKATLSSPRGANRDWLAEELGLVWLALDEARKPVMAPAYLHEVPDWIQIEGNPQQAEWQLDLAQLQQRFASVRHLLLVAYRYDQTGTLEQSGAQLSLNCLTGPSGADHVCYVPAIDQSADRAMICLEIYLRQNQWKMRALAEGSPMGLAALGLRMQLALDERSPRTLSQGSASGSAGHGQGQPGNGERRPGYDRHGNPLPDAWTGTAFAISPCHLVTCAHVADQARRITAQSLQGRSAVQVITLDEGCDLALLKLDTPYNDAPLKQWLTLAQSVPLSLGESLTTLGYPLSGIMGNQLQVTQGCIAALRGINQDLRFLQFTAPIQPGSSGSPLLNTQGQVIAMAISSISSAQNMNFAVRHQLIAALLESADIDPSHFPSPTAPPVSAQSGNTMVRQAQGSVWLLECER